MKASEYSCAGCDHSKFNHNWRGCREQHCMCTARFGVPEVGVPQSLMALHDDPRFPRIWKHGPWGLDTDHITDPRPAKPWRAKRQFVGNFETWEKALGGRLVDGHWEYGGAPVWQRVSGEGIGGDAEATWVLLWPCQCGTWTSDPAAHECGLPEFTETTAGQARPDDLLESPPCTCMCHVIDGIHHVVPCCYPGMRGIVLHLKHRVELAGERV